MSVSDDFIHNLYTNIPKVRYKYDNRKCIAEWRKVLGNTTPVGGYVYNGNDLVRVRCITKYHSMALDKDIYSGQELEVTLDRANQLVVAGVVTIL